MKYPFLPLVSRLYKKTCSIHTPKHAETQLLTQALKRKEMITMNNREKDFRLIAPDIDSLLRFFRNGHTNATSPTPAVIAAIDPVFDALRNLATSKRNDEYHQ